MLSSSGAGLFTKFASTDTFATKVAAVLNYLAISAYHARRPKQASVLAKAAQALHAGSPLVTAFEKAGCDRRAAAKQALAATKVALRLQKKAADLGLNALFANTLNDEATRHAALSKFLSGRQGGIEKFLQQSTSNAARGGGQITGGLAGAGAGAALLPMLLQRLFGKVPGGGRLAAGLAGAGGGGYLGSWLGGHTGSLAGRAPKMPDNIRLTDAKTGTPNLPQETLSPLLKLLQSHGQPSPATAVPKPSVPKPSVPKPSAAQPSVPKAAAVKQAINGNLGPAGFGPPPRPESFIPPGMPPAGGGQPAGDGQLNPYVATALLSLLGAGGLAAAGGMQGAGVGGVLGSAVGLGRGNMAEGLGRGILRGGMTGAGGALGAAAGGALGGLSQDPGVAAMGALGGGLAGGLAGYAGSGKLLGKPAGRAEEEPAY